MYKYAYSIDQQFHFSVLIRHVCSIDQNSWVCILITQTRKTRVIIEQFNNVCIFMQWIQYRNENKQTAAIHNHLMNLTNIRSGLRSQT